MLRVLRAAAMRAAARILTGRLHGTCGGALPQAHLGTHPPLDGLVDKPPPEMRRPGAAAGIAFSGDAARTASFAGRVRSTSR